jgi:hypothetical protein
MDTTEENSFSVSIRDITAKMLWAAMNDDDDLATWFIDAAILWGVSKFMTDSGAAEALSPERAARFMRAEGELRAIITLGSKWFSDRYSGYL